MTEYSSQFQTILDREPEPAGGIESENVEYTVGDTRCVGYLARPAGGGIRPAVLVVHDWFGVTDSVRMRVDMLARLGFIAFAADVFGADNQPTQETAAATAGSFYGNPSLWRGRLTGAFERMLAEPDVQPGRTAAIGYCFGGSSALQLARTEAGLAAVVSFHGGLQAVPENELSAISAKLLVLTGSNDPVAPVEDVVEFQRSLDVDASIDWQVITYSGAMHAFTVPDAAAPDHGALFDPVAEVRSWYAMKQFLDEVLPR